MTHEQPWVPKVTLPTGMRNLPMPGGGPYGPCLAPSRGGDDQSGAEPYPPRTAGCLTVLKFVGRRSRCRWKRSRLARTVIRRSAGQGVCVVAERQVGLVFLHGVQSEDGVQPVQEAAQVGGLGGVGIPVADILDETAEPGDLVGDLGVARLIGAVGSAPPSMRFSDG